MRFRSRAYPLDPVLLLAWCALVGLGLVSLYSVSLARPEFRGLPLRQMLYIVAALTLQFAMTRRPPERWLALSPFLYGGTLLLLLLVPLAGVEVNGARRWLSLGPLGAVQPSEFVKVALLLFQVHCLRSGRRELAVLAALPPCLLALKQPDLGTAVCYAVGTWGVFFLHGTAWPALVGGPVLAAAVASQGLHDYQRERLLIFLDPERDPTGSGWNLIQAKIAVGSGGLVGLGLFQGLQKSLLFVPEQHTDFIFTVVGEEMGLVGATGLFLSYLLLFARGLNLARQSKEPLLCGSVLFLMAFQTFVNLGMVLGLCPVTGIPLPFVSYGGSALLAQSALLGLLQCEAEVQQRQARLQPRESWSPRTE